MMQMGYGEADWAGRPVIAILNTWSDANLCHAHFKHRVEDVKRGVLQAGGVPMELPIMSLTETLIKPTTMFYRNLVAMEVEETLRSHPLDGAVLMGGCDKTTPALLMGADHAGPAVHLLPAGAMAQAAGAAIRWAAAAMSGSPGTNAAPVILTARHGANSKTASRAAHGTCMTMGTAATMMSVTEALGLSLPGSADIPATAFHPRPHGHGHRPAHRGHGLGGPEAVAIITAKVRVLKTPSSPTWPSVARPTPLSISSPWPVARAIDLDARRL